MNYYRIRKNYEQNLFNKQMVREAYEKEREKCYFDRAKHNSVNACAHVCNNVKREEGL